MRRREFIALFGGVLVWRPDPALPQQGKMPVIGFLRSTAAIGSEHLVTAFRHGLNEMGFVEGQNVAIEYRWGEDHRDRLPGLAADLIRHQVAVIVGNSIAAQTASRVTATTPVVFVVGTDPVSLGLVSNLNRPGGNVTGVSFTTTELAGKRLGLLHEAAPGSSVTAALLDPTYLGAHDELRAVEEGSRDLGGPPSSSWLSISGPLKPSVSNSHPPSLPAPTRLLNETAGVHSRSWRRSGVAAGVARAASDRRRRVALVMVNGESDADGQGPRQDLSTPAR
jgi:hypothetical protein